MATQELIAPLCRRCGSSLTFKEMVKFSQPIITGQTEIRKWICRTCYP